MHVNDLFRGFTHIYSTIRRLKCFAYTQNQRLVS